MSYPGQPGQWGQQRPAQYGAPVGGQGGYQQPPTYGPGGQQFSPQASAPVGPADPPGITVDASYTPLAFLLGLLVKPKIFVNGQQVPVTQWGPNHIPVGPGQYHVRVVTPWLFDMGPAETVVPIAQQGQAARVYYRSPAIMFLNGAIGPVPQKTPGIIFTYIMGGIALLVILLNIIMVIAVGSSY